MCPSGWRVHRLGMLARIRCLHPPRLAAAVLVLGLLAAAISVDVLAASVAVAVLLGTALLLRRRDRAGERRAVLLVGGGLTASALVVALSLPAYRSPAPAILVADTAGGAPSLAAPQTPPTAPAPARRRAPSRVRAHPRPRATPSDPARRRGASPTVLLPPPRPPSPREVMGFAAIDEEDTASGVDQDVSALSSVAATGFQLTARGALSMTPSLDATVRAHLQHAAALAVLQNYDAALNGGDFNGDRALMAIRPGPARQLLLRQLRDAVTQGGWDGVVLDLEMLPPAARALYPGFVVDVKAAIGGRRTVVAVPAAPDRADPDMAGFDLAELGRAADQVVWMAYDQHDDRSGPGPIASRTWVDSTLDVATAAIPPGKLLLGVAGYGYVWPRTDGSTSGRADELTVPAARALAGQAGASLAWDPEAGEWHGLTADGRELWFDDATTGIERATTAAQRGLAGIALWRLGSEDHELLSRLPFPPVKGDEPTPERTVDHVEATGLVALTFDDGPDPTWTPQVLEVLARESVPATFFLVGKQVEAHPRLAQREIAAGHVVGSHTFSHPSLGSVPGWEQQLQVRGGAWMVEGVTGRRPLLFRSPYGDGDAPPDGTRHGSDQMAAGLGLQPEGWTGDPRDWARPGVDAIVDAAVSGAGRRTVLLLHDGGGNRSETVAALPRIIQELKARGYAFTTVDRLDGGAGTPYLRRSGLLSKTRGLALVGAVRVWLAIRRLVVWLLVATSVLALVRLAACLPLALLHRRRQRQRPAGGDDALPSTTIVVPAFDEAAVIGSTLRALARLDPAPLEVIVVDDGSRDATAEVVERHVDLVPGLRLLRQANAGKAAALDRGLGEARGEILVVIDADTVVEPGFLGAILPHFQDPAVGAVAGNVKVGNRRSLFSALQALEYVVSINLDKRAQAALGLVGIVPGAAGAFRSSAIRDIGGYPGDTLVEDADLTVALLRAGWRIDFEPRAVTWTEAPERLKEVLKQRRRWAFGTVQVAHKHSPALLDEHAGRVGLLLLPWQLVTQVVLPLFGPLADVFLVYLVVVHDHAEARAILALAVAADLVLSVVACLIDGERLRLVLLAPLMRLLWRPLQLLVLLRASRTWAIGGGERWAKLRRLGHVQLRSGPETS